MIPSIRGGWLPESAGDFAALQLARAAPHLSCGICKAQFSETNVHTSEGWRETQISGTCEDCYDELFREEAGDSGVDQL